MPVSCLHYPNDSLSFFHDAPILALSSTLIRLKTSTTNNSVKLCRIWLTVILPVILFDRPRRSDIGCDPIRSDPIQLNPSRSDSIRSCITGMYESTLLASVCSHLRSTLGCNVPPPFLLTLARALNDCLSNIRQSHFYYAICSSNKESQKR